MTSTVIKDNKADWNKFVSNMKKLNKTRKAEVGIFENQGLDLVEYAAVNEFGTRPGTVPKIPERSFLRSGIDETRRNGKLQAKVADLINLVIRGNITPLIALGRLGFWGAEIVKKKIDAGPFAPLADKTVKRKGHDTPLIETGRLRRNITWRIR